MSDMLNVSKKPLAKCAQAQAQLYAYIHTMYKVRALLVS